MGGADFPPGLGAVLRVKLTDFGLGVFVKLVGDAMGQVVEKMPAGALVNAGFMFIKPMEKGAKRLGGAIGQVVSWKGRTGFDSGEGDTVAGEKVGGQFLGFGLGAGQIGKVHKYD